MSDCKTPFLKSNVAESVTVFVSPEASVGSLYSTVIISPCRIQNAPSVVSAVSNLLICSIPTEPSVAVNPSTPAVVGQVVEAGPSVYLIVKSSYCQSCGLVQLL